MYADDTQLYKSSKPCDDTPTLIADVQTCIDAVKSRMAPNQLKMDDDQKTEIMPVSTISKLNSLGTNHICVGNDTVVFVHKAKNLAATLDSDLSMCDVSCQASVKVDRNSGACGVSMGSLFIN